MAKATSNATKTKTQMAREAIVKLQKAGREVTTAAILSVLPEVGWKNPKAMDIYQTSAWKELREKEKAGMPLTLDPAPAEPAKAIPTAAPVSANGAGMTKTQAISKVFGKLGSDAKPSVVIEEVKKKFNIDVSASLVSNYKSTSGKKKATKGKPGRPPKAQAGTATMSHAPGKASGGEFSVEDIRAVKELVGRIGADKVRELAKVLA